MERLNIPVPEIWFVANKRYSQEQCRASANLIMVKENIHETTECLEKFIRNLLLNENNELKTDICTSEKM